MSDQFDADQRAGAVNESPLEQLGVRRIGKVRVNLVYNRRHHSYMVSTYSDDGSIDTLTHCTSEAHAWAMFAKRCDEMTVALAFELLTGMSP